MSTESGTLRGFTDAIVQSRVHHARDKFLQSITKDDVLDLVSSRRPGFRCDYFKDPVRGSYNVCYFVEFEDEERWVVRIPIAPCLAFGSRSKLESEIAVMQLVAENTTIPLPKIHAYQLGDDSHALSSFLILEYIKGSSISPSHLDTLTNDQRTRLYTSLASIYLQLRRLEFPSIGCLARGCKGFEVGKRVASIDLNMQELEGLQPSTIQTRYGNHGILSSANGYTAMLLEISDNAFLNTRSRVLDQDHGEDALYHHDLFRRFVVDEWLDTKLNSGPFVLVHGDLQLVNCLLNEQMEVVSILDWEWSRVVPCQFFQPPLWLTNRNPGALAMDYSYSRFLKRFDEFLDVTRALERKLYGNELLSDEWTQGKDGFLVANALENWTEIDLFSADFISWKWYRGKADVGERIKIFMEEDPARRYQVSQLVQKRHDYKGELRKLRQDSPGNRGDDEVTAGPSLREASTAFLGRANGFFSRLCAAQSG